MHNTIKQILRKLLVKLELINDQYTELFSVLNKQKNIPIHTVIDVGASNGCWSNAVMKIFPDAFYYLIEANSVHLKALEEFKNKRKNADYIIAAASNNIGNIYFDDRDPFGGIASIEIKGNIVPSVTVDHCVKENNLLGPFMIKLDTHGFEIPILEGAINTLKQCNLLVVEVYNFQIAKDSLLFFEMCEYLLKNGFRSIGLIDRLYRPKDGLLWQFDLIFAPKTRKEFLDNKYK